MWCACDGIEYSICFGVNTCQNDNTWNIWHRLEENIKKDVKLMEWEVVDCVRLASNKVWWRLLVNVL